MMGKPFLKYAIVGTMALTLAFTSSNISSIEVGEQAPMQKEKMKGVNGQKKSLIDLKKENGLIVVFSCNTCPFVVGSSSFEGWEKQYNGLAELASQNKMGFVLVNSNEAKRGGDDSMDEMKKRALEKKYTMPYVVDKDSKLANAFGAKTTPHVFVMNQKMEVKYMGSIDNTWDSARKEDVPYLVNAMSQIVKGEVVKEATTAPRGCSIKRK